MDTELFKEKERTDTLTSDSSSSSSYRTDDGKIFDKSWTGATIGGATLFMVLSLFTSGSLLVGASGMLILGIVLGAFANKNVIPEVATGTFLVSLILGILSQASSITGLASLLLIFGFFGPLMSAVIAALVGGVGAGIGAYAAKKI